MVLPMNQVIRDGPLLREVAGVPGREAGMTESQGDYLARSFGLAGRAALVKAAKKKKSK